MISTSYAVLGELLEGGVEGPRQVFHHPEEGEGSGEGGEGGGGEL
jgi:hypothetical protein